MLFDHLVGDPAWLTRRLDCRPPATSSPRSAPPGSSSSCAATAAKLLYELELHAATDLTALRATLRRAARRRAEDRAGPSDYLARRRRRLLRRRVPALVGASRRSCGTSCASEFGEAGSRGARPARCCASCGSSASSRPRTSCSRTSPAPSWTSGRGRGADPRRPALARAHRRPRAAPRPRAGSRRRTRGRGSPRRASRCRASARPPASSADIDETSSRCSWRNQYEELLARRARRRRARA